MKLDRDQNFQGRGKYALLKLREIRRHEGPYGLNSNIRDAIATLEAAGILDWGNKETETEFFLIRLRDKYARAALLAYSAAASADDGEWAMAVAEMAERAGERNPFVKKPD